MTPNGRFVIVGAIVLAWPVLLLASLLLVPTAQSISGLDGAHVRRPSFRWIRHYQTETTTDTNPVLTGPLTTSATEPTNSADTSQTTGQEANEPTTSEPQAAVTDSPVSPEVVAQTNPSDTTKQILTETPVQSDKVSSNSSQLETIAEQNSNPTTSTQEVTAQELTPKEASTQPESPQADPTQTITEPTSEEPQQAEALPEEPATTAPVQEEPALNPATEESPEVQSGARALERPPVPAPEPSSATEAENPETPNEQIDQTSANDDTPGEIPETTNEQNSDQQGGSAENQQDQQQQQAPKIVQGDASKTAEMSPKAEVSEVPTNIRGEQPANLVNSTTQSPQEKKPGANEQVPVEHPTPGSVRNQTEAQLAVAEKPSPVSKSELSLNEPAAADVQLSDPSGEANVLVLLDGDKKEVKHQSGDETKETKQFDEQLNEERTFYLDMSSCQQLLGHLPEPVLNMTVRRILNTLRGANCSSHLEQKLMPVKNKLIKGHVFESSGFYLGLGDLLTSAEYGSTRVSCSFDPQQQQQQQQQSVDSSGKISFHLELEHISSKPVKLLAGWRHYPKFQAEDEILLDQLGSERASSATSGNANSPARPVTFNRPGSQQAPLGAKCESFKFESGLYQLVLDKLQPSLRFEVTLRQFNKFTYGASSEHGGSIKVERVRLARAYLSHEMTVSGVRPARGSSASWLLGPQASVQVIHDNNSHHRRNNWLLDMYANWLGHESRHQLVEMFHALAERLAESSCFGHSEPAAQRES